ncbi:hypothetical protein NMY22_g8120 [Coprinellus aureogranulatus]|nr:hypothetical protein NMY22_g8120 [Coprinellus aureogranulatus]
MILWRGDTDYEESDPDGDELDSEGSCDSPPPPPPRKKYFLADYPSDDPEVLREAGLNRRGITLSYQRDAPRPTTCLFDKLNRTEKVVKWVLGDHIYCNCVKCTRILKQKASPEERMQWLETRSGWLAKARQERAVYIEEKISKLAEEIELRAQRSRMVVSVALALSAGELLDWKEKGRWKEKARERVLEENPDLKT